MGAGLLDLDGTLTDSKVGITRSVQYALRRAGVDVPDLETLTPYIGPALQESFVALAGFSQADAIRAVASYREYFAEIGIFENIVYPGIPECLEALQVRGWRLAVATSKPTAFAGRILDHFSLRSHFEAVVGAGLDGSRRQKHEITLPPPAWKARQTDPDVLKMLNELLEHHTHAEVADRLNEAGHRSGEGKRFNRSDRPRATSESRSARPCRAPRRSGSSHSG